MPTNFYLDRRTDRSGDAAIRISISINGSRFITSAKIKIAPSKWDPKKQQVRKGASNAKGITWTAINATLAKLTDHFANLESECIQSHISPTSEDIKSHFAKFFRSDDNESTPDDFWSAYNKFIHDQSIANDWTLATIAKFKSLRNHISSWRKTPTFNDFDNDGLTSFTTYIRRASIRNTTAAKIIGFLKWFLKWSYAKGHLKNNDFQSFSPKLKRIKNPVVFLDWSELMKVYKYTIPSNGETITLHRHDGSKYNKVIHDASGIAKARDIFCLCCFTSLRYSDAINLKWSNIRDDIISITTIKTADTIHININKYAQSILDKYADSDFGIYVMPRITNQRMNIYLKDLCELCEINTPITLSYYIGSQRFDETRPKYELIATHTGRRTFICNALMLGIPAEIVMKWTGHSDYKAMQPYIDITNEAKSAEMNKFNAL